MGAANGWPNQVEDRLAHAILHRPHPTIAAVEQFSPAKFAPHNPRRRSGLVAASGVAAAGRRSFSGHGSRHENCRARAWWDWSSHDSAPALLSTMGLRYFVRRGFNRL